MCDSRWLSHRSTPLRRDDDELLGERVGQRVGQQGTEAVGKQVGAFGTVEVQGHRPQR